MQAKEFARSIPGAAELSQDTRRAPKTNVQVLVLELLIYGYWLSHESNIAS